MGTLATILKDNWRWRAQIWQLALFDLRKQSRGAVLGWVWFFIKPAIYVFCFWFALDVGLRAGNVDPDAPPYILWLCAGILPWFFMRDILNKGIDVMHRYPYLVNKVKFPLSAISSIYLIASMIIQLALQVVLLIIYFVCGQHLDLHLLQIPLLLVLMYVFWFFFSLFMSPLCAMSKDVKNMMTALSTPFFWLSGVLFDVKSIDISWIQTILYFNPITFFVEAFRGATCYKTWFWDNPTVFGCFCIVFVLTIIFMCISYSKLNEEVSDAL